MSWKITYVKEAIEDMDCIYNYISNELQSPTVAAKHISTIMSSIRNLEDMPMRHRLYEEEPWYSRGLRFFPINNYIVFYVVDELTREVAILRIMYKGRDIKSQLDN